MILLAFGPLADCAVTSPRIALERSQTSDARAWNIVSDFSSDVDVEEQHASPSPSLVLPIVSSITVTNRSKLVSIKKARQKGIAKV